MKNMLHPRDSKGRFISRRQYLGREIIKSAVEIIQNCSKAKPSFPQYKSIISLAKYMGGRARRDRIKYGIYEVF